MTDDKYLRLKRLLIAKGIHDVIINLETPTTDAPYLSGIVHPVRTTVHTGEIILKLSFRVRPDDMRAIDHALTILKELKDIE